MDPRDRLIVALDVSTREQAMKLIDRLEGVVTCFKVGLEAYAAGWGHEVAITLAMRGAKVMADLKLLDIPETVSRAVLRLEAQGVSFATIHAQSQTLRAAVKASRDVKILGVTVLTSMTDADLESDFYPSKTKVQDLVLNRALVSQLDGAFGVVASPQEVKALRAARPGLALIVPGIRPDGADAADQKRIGTPSQAIADGADYLVVGRPIHGSPDPHRAAEEIVAEIARTAAGGAHGTSPG